MKTGFKTYVVLGVGGDYGVEVLRHPTRKPEKAYEKAKEMAEDFPGRAFYVAEIYVKVVNVVKPAMKWTELEQD